MPEGDQTGILTVRRLAGQHLRRAVERVALDDRNLETKLVERDIHQGIFRCVLTRETDHDRSRHPAVRNPPAELGSSCVMRVEVPLGGVHRQMSQDYCLVFTRSEERRLGKGCVSPCSSWVARYY